MKRCTWNQASALLTVAGLSPLGLSLESSLGLTVAVGVVASRGSPAVQFVPHPAIAAGCDPTRTADAHRVTDPHPAAGCDPKRTPRGPPDARTPRGRYARHDDLRPGRGPDRRLTDHRQRTWARDAVERGLERQATHRIGK